MSNDSSCGPFIQRDHQPRRSTDNMSTRTLMAFFGLAFGLCWGVASLLLVFADALEPILGPVSGTNPLFVLAVYAPGIAAVALVWRHFGVRGLGSFLSRVTLWRMPIGWWAFLILGVPAVKYLGAVLSGTIDDPFLFSPWYTLLPALLLTLFIGPVGEEFGWRGLALPLLQRRFAPLWASLVLGSVWGLWHFPAFLLSGTPQSAWSIAPYTLGVLSLGVIVTPMFNAAKGSILIPILFHFQMNGPQWPEAQPWENYLFAAVAVIIVVVHRGSMLGQARGVTSVLAPRVDPRIVRRSVRT